MLQRCILRPYHVLALVLCVSASEDFDWTKNERTSFYYGTFPTGNDILLIKKSPKSAKRCNKKYSTDICCLLCFLCRILVGSRQLSLSDWRSLEHRWQRNEHLGCVRPHKGENIRKWHGRLLLWGLLQIQGDMLKKIFFSPGREAYGWRLSLEINVTP